MIRLNLIPQSIKHNIKLKRINKFFYKINFVLIIFTFIITSSMLSAKFIIQDKFKKITEENNIKTLGLDKENLSKTQKINNDINVISEIQNNFIFWSKIVEDLSNKIPENVIISYIKIDKDSQTIKIRGHATFRSDLLIFKQNLDDSLIYNDIEFPIKNILQKENVDFDISIKINLSDINKI